MEMVNCELMVREITAKYFYIIITLIGLFFTWSLVIFRYYLKVNKKSIELGTADKQHDIKHTHNEQRIKFLEEENGTKMKKMEELNSEIKELKTFISKNITKD